MSELEGDKTPPVSENFSAPVNFNQGDLLASKMPENVEKPSAHEHLPEISAPYMSTASWNHDTGEAKSGAKNINDTLGFTQAQGRMPQRF